MRKLFSVIFTKRFLLMFFKESSTINSVSFSHYLISFVSISQSLNILYYFIWQFMHFYTIFRCNYFLFELTSPQIAKFIRVIWELFVLKCLPFKIVLCIKVFSCHVLPYLINLLRNINRFNWKIWRRMILIFFLNSLDTKTGSQIWIHKLVNSLHTF